MLLTQDPHMGGLMRVCCWCSRARSGMSNGASVSEVKKSLNSINIDHLAYTEVGQVHPILKYKINGRSRLQIILILLFIQLHLMLSNMK